MILNLNLKDKLKRNIILYNFKLKIKFQEIKKNGFMKEKHLFMKFNC